MLICNPFAMTDSLGRQSPGAYLPLSISFINDRLACLNNGIPKVSAIGVSSNLFDPLVLKDIVLIFLIQGF
jgi:hypothetical protein